MNSKLKRTALLCIGVAITTFNLYSTQESNMRAWYHNKRALVTGGCGFIGSHIVEKLVDLGAQVTILDDLSTGSYANIAAVADKVALIEGSITDKTTCIRALQDIDVVFHLAAYTSVPGSVADPIICHVINIDGTFNLLEAMRITGCKRIVFSSSSSVYGATEQPCSEETPCNPLSPYGFSKYMGELMLRQYALNYGIDAVSLRYFNVYGARQNPHAQYAAVVAKFKDCMSKNEPVTIFGDGMQTRDYIPVEQVAYANVLVGYLADEQLRGQVFNIATGTSINLLELFDQLKVLYPGYTHEPRFAPARAGDVMHTTAICDKFRQLASCA
jgi:UDP-glucose 4-epimerase